MKSITVADTNLFKIAAAELGDALHWISIARLNSMKDPMISGVVTIAIPSEVPATADGISQY